MARWATKEVTNALREFSLEEANALIPTLHRLISQQMVLQDEIQEFLQEIYEITGSLPAEIHVCGDEKEASYQVKSELVQKLQRFEDGWLHIQRFGCVVKDPRTGLVDFYGRVNGELVYFCWRFGEESVSYYHGLDEGFVGRKPIQGSCRHRLLSLKPYDSG